MHWYKTKHTPNFPEFKYFWPRVAIYRDRIARFNTRVEKMLNKHRADKFRIGKKSLMVADVIPIKSQERD